MSNFVHHDRVLELIKEKGPLGVNELAKALSVPVTTLQRQLHNQSFFKLNNNKKWDLATNIANETVNDSLKDFDSVIQSQLDGINALFGMLSSNINSTITLLSSQKALIRPVADTTVNIHPKLKELDKSIKDVGVVFNKYVDKVPEIYRELIENVDLHKLTIEMGTNYINNVFNTEITLLFLEQSSELSEEVVNTLKNYQK